MTWAKGCPGARTIREATPEYIACPHCGREMEIWSDELVARCPHCKQLVPQQNKGASCIDWCAFAAQCVGAEKYRRIKGTLPQPAGASPTPPKPKGALPQRTGAAPTARPEGREGPPEG